MLIQHYPPSNWLNWPGGGCAPYFVEETGGGDPKSCHSICISNWSQMRQLWKDKKTPSAVRRVWSSFSLKSKQPLCCDVFFLLLLITDTVLVCVPAVAVVIVIIAIVRLLLLSLYYYSLFRSHLSVQASRYLLKFCLAFFVYSAPVSSVQGRSNRARLPAKMIWYLWRRTVSGRSILNHLIWFL